VASATQDQAVRTLGTHTQSIDELHRALAATPGVDKERLQAAVAKYKAANKQFSDDALECMN
jgi:hypothetical protein